MRRTWELIGDPARFLDVAGAYLAVDPVIASVVTMNATREAARRASGGAPPQHPHWYAALLDDSGVVGAVAMRTAPAPPHALFCLPMADDDAVTLARLLHARGETALTANGHHAAGHALLTETARLRGGGRVVTTVETVLWEVRDVVGAPATPGRLRAARHEDLTTLLEWFASFLPDADEQAGRPRGSMPHLPPDPDEVRRRVDDGLLWVWETHDRPVHVTGVKGPVHGVARIGPVYTPAEHRGRGYGRAAVTAVSTVLRNRGVRVCLFTDRSNPTSNALYASIGYEPVVRMADLAVVD